MSPRLNAALDAVLRRGNFALMTLLVASVSSGFGHGALNADLPLGGRVVCGIGTVGSLLGGGLALITAWRAQ